MATILVVDDEPVVLNLCKQMLQLGGATVLTASGGAEALRIFQSEKQTIDLALLDIMMPQMNGIELASRLKAANPAVRIVLMTGYSLREIQQLAGDGSPYRIIWKPFKAQSLLRMIENALEGGTSESSEVSGTEET